MSVPDKADRPSPLSVPIFPVAMSIAWILEAFGSNGDPLPHLWRPLIITTILVTASTGIVWITGRRRPLRSLIAGVVVLVFLKAWPLLGVVLAISAWRAAVGLIRRGRGMPPLAVAGPVQVLNLANTFGVVLLAIALISLPLNGIIAFPPQPAARGTPIAMAPNMYFVLLDGYPRQDTLAELGIDNTPFIGELQRRGFAIAPRSHTNYHNTLLTLTSMLNGQYLAGIPELEHPAADRAGEERQLNRALNDAGLLENLRTRGYAIIDSPSAYGAATLFSADVLMTSGTINQFDQRVLSQTYLGDLLSILSPGLVEGWLRDAVLMPISKVASVAGSDSASPHFMFAHVLSPHPPFLFNAAGELPEVHACYTSGCALWTTELQVLGISAPDYQRLLAGQIEFLNGKVLAMVDQIAADDPTAIVVLFGDHGIRFDAGVSEEYFRNFFAARTPGHPNLFPDDVSPVNVLAMLENTYLGTTFPIRDYEAWESMNLLLNLGRWIPDPT